MVVENWQPPRRHSTSSSKVQNSGAAVLRVRAGVRTARTRCGLVRESARPHPGTTARPPDDARCRAGTASGPRAIAPRCGQETHRGPRHRACRYTLHRSALGAGCARSEAVGPLLGQRRCCYSHSLVGSPQELVGVFRRRISWDDGVMREPAEAGAVAFPMNRCCRSGGDVGARAPSVGKGWASAAHLSIPCPHGPQDASTSSPLGAAVLAS